MDPRSDSYGHFFDRKTIDFGFHGEPMDAVKTGMLGNEANIAQAAKMIQQQQVKQVVIDPVIACKGTAHILQPKSVDALIEYLLPLADVVTPNLIEAGILSGMGT